MTRNRQNCANTSTPLRTSPRRASRRRPRGEQPLHQELIRAVRRERQRHAADDAGPQRVDRVRVGRQIQERELAGGRPGGHDRRPAAVNPIEEREEHEQRAREVDEHLDGVGPDHRRRAATHRVDDHRGAEHDHDARHRHVA